MDPLTREGHAEMTHSRGSERRFRQVPLPSGIEGRLFIDEMPGRRGALEDTWAAAREVNVSCIVSLAGPLEIEHKSPPYAVAIATAALPCERIAFPIVDFGVPNDAGALHDLARGVAARLRAGERLLVHCGAGIGRSGMFAICVLLALGAGLDDARVATRQAQAGPETDQQEDFVRAFAREGVVKS